MTDTFITNQNSLYSIEFFLLVVILAKYKETIKFQRYVNKMMYPLDNHNEHCKCPACDLELQKYYDSWARIK